MSNDSVSVNKSSATATAASVTTLKPAAPSNEFTASELKDYSIALNVILVVGIVCHVTVIVILVYQQYKRIKYNQVQKDFVRSDTTTDNGPSDGEAGFGARTKPPRKFSQKKYLNYNNYVTFAFVFHQSIVDLTRIIYCLLYANSLQMQLSASGAQTTATSPVRLQPVLLGSGFLNVNVTTAATQSSLIQQIDGNIAIFFYDVYAKYCSQMASFYSILSMVTLINILAILISETCRFYDLKLNSSDTSSCCCVLFGVLLIWISSLIIISSLMLVGVADSAAPTWRCDLGEESTTRSLVINIVWFLLVAFIILIALLYSCSLYKELSSLDYKHHRLSLYAVNISLMAFKPNANFLRHHILIVEETSKRLIILFCLIVVFCLTFLPNFLMTVLKNTLDERTFALKPFNIISSIANLSNPTFNSIILLVLCLKANDSFLTDENDYDMDDIEHEPEHPVKAYFRRFKSLLLLRSNDETKSETNRNAIQIDDGDANERLACLSKPADFGASSLCVTAQTPPIFKRPPRSRSRSRSSHHGEESCRTSSKSPRSLRRSFRSEKGTMSQLGEQVHPSVTTTTSVKEFYSKVGNRLGNMSPS